MRHDIPLDANETSEMSADAHALRPFEIAFLRDLTAAINAKTDRPFPFTGCPAWRRDVDNTRLDDDGQLYTPIVRGMLVWNATAQQFGITVGRSTFVPGNGDFIDPEGLGYLIRVGNEYNVKCVDPSQPPDELSRATELAAIRAITISWDARSGPDLSRQPQRPVGGIDVQDETPVTALDRALKAWYEDFENRERMEYLEDKSNVWWIMVGTGDEAEQWYILVGGNHIRAISPTYNGSMLGSVKWTPAPLNVLYAITDAVYIDQNVGRKRGSSQWTHDRNLMGIQ